MSDRQSTAGWLVLLALAAAVVAVSRWLRQTAPAPPQEAPRSAPAQDIPTCAATGCSAPAVEALATLVLWRPLAWLAPVWRLWVPDPDAVEVCAVHALAWRALLGQRVAQLRAEHEAHVHRATIDAAGWLAREARRAAGLAARSAVRAPTAPQAVAPDIPPE